MRAADFLAKSREQLRAATWTKIALCVSVVLNLLLAVAAVNRDITIHLPPSASADELVIQDADASQETKLAFGLYISGLLGNVSPNNAAFVERAIGRFVTPRAYQTYLQNLQQEAIKIREEQLTTNFQATDASYDAKTDTVEIGGLLITRGVTAVEQQTYRTFRLKFVVVGHQPMLDALSVSDDHSRLTVNR
ncbi:hypothetical protein C7S18_23460 (plasmid) [Ahniella affigens]|uniref:Type IV conjugative transfer system protein TraE n=1 Tax=Ahniella affigens TaxID=2021234 RepID=A0A2P1PZK4_9GAMM|nr:TraE/TraK family type IV conjugative transfer system protein [Ahniella affigens]AVQ00257.1 hypothetical protein C7S18_23460 [Ahniella affigens]